MSAARIDEVRTEAQRHWDELASKARRSRRAKDASLFTFLIAVSIPVIVPYFWLLTLAFSAGMEGEPLERIHRDLTIATQHTMISDSAYEALGTRLLKPPVQAPA